MSPDRCRAILAQYPRLRIAVAGDFFLDRYLEIDPARGETSIETGLPVFNVVRTRAQPGAAGTVLENLVALGVGNLHPVGFCGNDGEGYELRRELASRNGVDLEHFLTAPDRRTPVYCKPLVIEPDGPPRELNRLDSKNWTPTPEPLTRDLANRLADLAMLADALILMDQVDQPGTGVIGRAVLDAADAAACRRPSLTILADSRRGLADYPPLGFKMNLAELARMAGKSSPALDPAEHASALARRNGRPVFVTMAEGGILGAWPGHAAEHVPARPVRGPIDVVGAGDSVTANLAAALAAGASPTEAMELAMAAASIVVHQLGTTGTATVDQLRAAFS